MEYINKRWDLPTMEKKVENLKKVISPFIVDSTLAKNKEEAETLLDALYLTFYELKDIYCKVRRSLFGSPKMVEYDKKNKWEEYIYTNPYTSVTWTNACSSSNTTYTSACYDYNPYSWTIRYL